jgi:hypothetical protein
MLWRIAMYRAPITIDPLSIRRLGPVTQRNPAASRLQAQARAKALVPVQLAPLLDGLSLKDLAATRRVIFRASPRLSFTQLLALLPLKVATQLLASRNDALMQFLLAWGKDLRAQAAVAKRAQKRRDANAQGLRANEARHQAAAYAAARVQQARAILTAQAYDANDSRRPGATYGATAQSMKPTDMQGALTPPLRSGYALRGPVLRFTLA